MFDELLMRHCAPTLMHVKTASMFTCKYSSYEDLCSQIVYSNDLLNAKGIYLTLLKCSCDRAVIYVYLKKKLKTLLVDKDIVSFLECYGYDCSSLEGSIALLSKRFMLGDDLPHEVGIFLGYPLNDVKSFIEHSGQNSLYTGYWKVYHNKEQSIKMFNVFDKCRVIFRNKFLKYNRLPI